MIHDNIQLAIKDIRTLEEKLKGVKKDIRQEEKIDNEAYLDLKAGLKNMRAQLKESEDEQMSELLQSDFYNELKDMKIKAEEEVAQATERLFKLLAQVPLKPFEMDMKEEEGFTKIQAHPEMRIYVNGKEMKKRSI